MPLFVFCILHPPSHRTWQLFQASKTEKTVLRISSPTFSTRMTLFSHSLALILGSYAKFLGFTQRGRGA
jgi:hypothetical protein